MSDCDDPEVSARGPLLSGIAAPEPPAPRACAPEPVVSAPAYSSGSETASTFGRRTDRASKNVMTSSMRPATTVEIIVPLAAPAAPDLPLLLDVAAFEVLNGVVVTDSESPRVESK